MRIKPGFLLHSMNQEYVVVPVEERTKQFHGMIRLNETAAYMWKTMERGEFSKEDLIQSLLDQYELSLDHAEKTVETSLRHLLDAGIIEE